MEFTQEELIGLNSILGESPIEGIALPVIPFQDRQAFVEKTIQSLEKKGIVEDKKKLTPLGSTILRALEGYKKAENKLFVNHLRIGLADEEIVVVIAGKKDKYDISLQRKEILIQALLTAYPYLKEAQAGRTKREAKYLPYKEWEASVKEIPEENLLVISPCHNGRLEEQKLYYWKDGEAYCYIPKKNTRYRKGARDIRVELLHDFEIGEKMV